MNNDKLDVKGLLLDLDGTILDTKPAYIEAAKIAFKFVGGKPPENALLLEIPKRIEQKKPIDDIVADSQRFLDAYLKAFYSIASKKTMPIANVKDVFEVLSNRVKLAVITMRFMPKKAIADELDQFGLAQYITHIVTALDTHLPKPSPEALIKAVTAMDVQMCECAIVGDSVIDVKAGKAAGSKTVAVLSGLYSRLELSVAKPNFIINDISELPKLINQF